MKEYIEREAALSAQNKSMNLAECRKRLERLPAADVVPVVLCGDCKHFAVARNGVNGFCEIHSDIGNAIYEFCSDGEERDNG